VLEEPVSKQTLLAVFPPGEDRTALNNILAQPGWELVFSHTLAETQAALRGCPVVAMLSEVRLSDGHCWKDILHELHRMPDPPPLIVADRLANDALWAEVLNLGGYDLLTKPFDKSELLHAVTTACHFSVDQRERRAVLQRPAKAAELEGVTAEEGACRHLAADSSDV